MKSVAGSFSPSKTSVKSRLALVVRIFAKCEFILENARSFATFAKGYFDGKFSLQFWFAKDNLKMRKRKFYAFATFAKGILGLAQA